MLSIILWHKREMKQPCMITDYLYLDLLFFFFNYMTNIYPRVDSSKLNDIRSYFSSQRAQKFLRELAEISNVGVAVTILTV